MNLEYGCIGEKLGHSFSKEIHNLIADYDYQLTELTPDELKVFMTERNFKAINVTIPYKEAVISYLHEIDDAARAIGAVNTIVNKDGRLYGYNTDFYGRESLLSHAGVTLSQKKVAILGTGGTSKTAAAVSKALGAKAVLAVSRESRTGVITYDELYKNHSDVDVIINTTPVGMYPRIDETPIDVSAFPSLSGVIDAVYNPLRTHLVLDAQKQGIPAEGGLYMLVAQAIRASEIFLDTNYGKDTLEAVYKRILRDKENIVLIGMPASGKSTVARLLSILLKRDAFDTDSIIENKANKKIAAIFADEGESCFRDLESCAIGSVADMHTSVIATGGGAILREKNVDNLKLNGRLYFIDRPLDALIPTSSRPLASSIDAIQRRYHERYGIYKSTADKVIDACCSPDEVANKIKEDFLK
ncbi:MAG: shikimate dehydrogenase [Clostridia bacterium]|nr:shikimate dehydrogenase [Clostridia bacterium]